jgi:hypothetical protein
LPSPLSPEFLALEGARLEDEGAAQNVDVVFEGEEPAQAKAFAEAEAEPEEEEQPIEVSAAEIDEDDEAEAAPSAPEVEPPPEEEQAPPDLEAASIQPPPNDDDTPLRLRRGVTPATSRPALRDPDATMVQAAPLAETDEAVTTEVRVPAAPKLPASLICIDSDLPLLERLKGGLAGQPIRVHIFQSPADALARFKQYVVRGEIPAVVLGSGVEDPIDARQGLGWRRFAGRMLAIAPRMRLVVLAKMNEKVAAPGLVVLNRPEARPKPGDVEHFLRALTHALATGA